MTTITYSLKLPTDEEIPNDAEILAEFPELGRERKVPLLETLDVERPYHGRARIPSLYEREAGRSRLDN